MALPLLPGRRGGRLRRNGKPTVRVYRDARADAAVLGAHSYLPYDHLLDQHREALRSLLDVVVVDGGHTVLWDAFDETADAVVRFL